MWNASSNAACTAAPHLENKLIYGGTLRGNEHFDLKSYDLTQIVCILMEADYLLYILSWLFSKFYI